MLRYKEKEDLEARFTEVDSVVERWRERLTRVPSKIRGEFRERLMISLIYHDAALEGDVLTYSEIKAAIDPTIISDSTLIPSYEHIKRYHEATLFGERWAKASTEPFSLETLRSIYALLAPEEREAGLPYRTENPLHRLYYHDISAPEHIEDKMKEFVEWLEVARERFAPPIELMADIHLRFMAIFPWAKQSGRCARIASNLLLRQADYPLAVLHSIDRQAYYEALRSERDDLVSLYLEAVETSAMSEIRVYDEAEEKARRAS